MSEPIDLVVFDLGGVLVRIVRSWGEAHARAGLAPHPIAEDATFLARRASLLDALSVSRIAPAEYYAGVAEASSGVYTPDDIQRIHLAALGGVPRRRCRGRGHRGRRRTHRRALQHQRAALG